jgi:hypothetical protein
MKNLTRRTALKTISSCFGSLAFAAMVADQSKADQMADAKNNPLAVKSPHFKARAKRVIFLSMRGAPSTVDMFDYKPQLIRDGGKPGKYGGEKLLASPWKFKKQGKSGLWMSSLMPHLGSVADELCMLHGMHSDQPNHADATIAVHTGNAQFVRPSMGAWSLYGLGTMNASLPGFIVLGQAGSAQNYGSSFLPAVYQGTTIGNSSAAARFRRSNDAISVPNIKNPNIDVRNQRKQLDFIQSLNIAKLKRETQQSQVEGMIQSMELAFTMQSTMPELLDLKAESESTKRLYGIGEDATDKFGRHCLLARRMVESGVRFVEVVNSGWDHHNNLKSEMEDHCAQIDKPIMGLIKDLKNRGLLEDTLVVWAGEFGRTPHGQGGDGRNHNNKGYTTFMAGGGVKSGFRYGATDEHGYDAVEGKIHTHDWHATILHLMGLDHKKLTYPHAGRDFRLTDVAGNAVTDILA